MLKEEFHLSTCIESLVFLVVTAKIPFYAYYNRSVAVRSKQSYSQTCCLLSSFLLDSMISLKIYLEMSS